ncbi:MAG: efflux RND transporter periplasmic adaptor subunit [Phycisphaerae bacterium]
MGIRTSILVGIVGMALLAGIAGAEEFAADTKPSKDYVLRFERSGTLRKLAVKEGDRVDANQLIARLNDRAEQAKLQQLKAQADSTIRIKAAEAQLEQKKVDLKRFRDLYKRGVATEVEVQHAELDVKISALSVQLYEFQHTQDQLAYREAKLQLERMTLECPLSGTVEEVYVRQGGTVEAMDKVVRIVNVDPLWVDVYVPVDQACKLTPAKGEKDFGARVRFDPDANETVPARIIHRSQVATGSIPRTLRIRLEVPNESLRPAGQRVLVSFPALDANTKETGLAESATGGMHTSRLSESKEEK